MPRTISETTTTRKATQTEEKMSLWKPPGSKNWKGAFRFKGKTYTLFSGTENKRAAQTKLDDRKAAVRKEWEAKSQKAKKIGCAMGDLDYCIRCEELFDKRAAFLSDDGTLRFCSEDCRDRYAKQRSPVPTLAEFAPRFMAAMESAHRSKPKTCAHYRIGVKRALEYPALANARLDAISSELISQFAEWRRKRKTVKGTLPEIATVNRQIETLRRLLHVAAEWRIIVSTPKIHRLPGEKQRERIVTHDEERVYLSKAEPLMREIATILVDTGLRPEECYRLKWEHVHLAPAGAARFGRVHIPYGKTKNAKRDVPLTARAKSLLEMRCDDKKEGWVFPAPTMSGHVETSTLRRAHASALTNSGVKPFVLYTLRHTFLTRLGEANVDAFSIMKIAGHHSITISARYVHPTPERIESAFALLESYNAQQEKEISSRVN
jgi:integrase